jgi:tetratricopeptide (TPR) repeat protein
MAIAAAPVAPAGHAPEVPKVPERSKFSPVHSLSGNHRDSSGTEDGGQQKHADAGPVTETQASQEHHRTEPQAPVSNAARKEPPGKCDRLFQRACGFHRRDDLDQAIAFYQAALKENPDHAQARLNLVAAYLQTGAYQQAYPLVAKLYSEDPANQQVMLNLAVAHIGCGRDRQALALLDKAAKLPNAPLFEITFHKAMALGHLGRPKAALACYRRAESMRPDDPDLLFNMALACDQQQQYGAAVNCYRKYLEHAREKDTSQISQIRRRIRILQAYGAEKRLREKVGE